MTDLPHYLSGPPLNNLGVIWPDIFITGQIDENYDEALLCSDALKAWGNCMMRSTLPEKFGDVMAEIHRRLGVSARPESIIAYAKSKGYI